MFSHFTAQHLCATLTNLPKVDLLGMRLMQAHPQAPFQTPANIPRETLQEAVVEIVAYTECCQEAIQRLRDLTPQPLAQPLWEFAL
jgi:hypothetical protein